MIFSSQFFINIVAHFLQIFKRERGGKIYKICLAFLVVEFYENEIFCFAKDEIELCSMKSKMQAF